MVVVAVVVAVAVVVGRSRSRGRGRSRIRSHSRSRSRRRSRGRILNRSRSRSRSRIRSRGRIRSRSPGRRPGRSRKAPAPRYSQDGLSIQRPAAENSSPKSLPTIRVHLPKGAYYRHNRPRPITAKSLRRFGQRTIGEKRRQAIRDIHATHGLQVQTVDLPIVARAK